MRHQAVQGLTLLLASRPSISLNGKSELLCCESCSAAKLAASTTSGSAEHAKHPLHYESLGTCTGPATSSAVAQASLRFSTAAPCSIGHSDSTCFILQSEIPLLCSKRSPWQAPARKCASSIGVLAPGRFIRCNCSNARAGAATAASLNNALLQKYVLQPPCSLVV